MLKAQESSFGTRKLPWLVVLIITVQTAAIDLGTKKCEKYQNEFREWVDARLF